MYTINEVARLCDLTAHTLRYYDKEGLLPFVSRTPAGNRAFSERDVEMVRLICCLKDTGMPIKEIRAYIELCMDGPDTIAPRKRMMTEHRQAVERQIEALTNNLRLIDHKIAFYDSDEARHAVLSRHH